MAPGFFKMRRFFSVLVMCCALGGCVLGSVNPFYTPDLAVEMPELYGDWTYEVNTEPGDSVLVTISPGKIAISDKGLPPADSRLTFFKVDGQLFADLYPDEGQFKFDLVGEGVPVHLVCLVTFKDGRLLFNPLDYEWLIKQAQSGTVDIPYKRSSPQEDADIVLTASPEQWVGFLKTYHSDPQAFPHTDEGWLIRKQTGP